MDSKGGWKEEQRDTGWERIRAGGMITGRELKKRAGGLVQAICSTERAAQDFPPMKTAVPKPKC